jgi:glutathione S-transferase
MTKIMTHSPSLRLYGMVPYDRSAKVRWVLTELGVDFENRWLDREKREHETTDFLRLNPMGRIPVLQIDGDQVIFESGAICAYLGDLFADRGIVPSVGTPERPEYQQWMYFASSTLDVFQTRVMVIEDIPPGEIQTTKLNALQSDLRDALVALDRALVKGSYLVANQFTVADICASYHLYWCGLWPELDAIIQDFPRVVAYVKRMKDMPSSIKANVFSYKG